MSAARQPGTTAAEFLRWEGEQPGRWEFDGFAPVAMVGGTVRHSRLCRNLAGLLFARLRGGPCEVFTEGLKILAADSIRYPAAFVACGPNAGNATVAENPVVVFEVESPSTARVDFGVKNEECRATPSILRYVILSQERPVASVWERRGADWVGSLLTGPDAVLPMPEIGAELTLAELYEGVLDG